jgi:hypothetical protein
MAATLKVVDQHLGGDAGQRSAGIKLRVTSERVTAREIIRSRVEAEVHALNLGRKLHAERGVGAELPDAEQRLNALPTRSWAWMTSLDVEAEIGRATTAFARRQFVMLLDDRQIDDLDEAVGLRPDSEVVFVHLTPLKGG